MIKTATKKNTRDRKDRQEYGFTGINVYDKYNAYVTDLIKQIKNREKKRQQKRLRHKDKDRTRRDKRRQKQRK